MFDELFVLDWDLGVWKLILRILVAVICGVAVGFERKTRSKEAGIRTHAIVCMAAALFMILSKYAYIDLVEFLGAKEADPSRIASTVVTGIGFLGAGIIVYRRDVMHGLTTAAGIWATAAIGMAIGAGFYVLGIVATVFLVTLQIIFHLPFKVFATQHLSVIKMAVWLETSQTFSEISACLSIKKISSYVVKRNEDKLIANVTFISTKPYTVDELNAFMSEHPEHIISIEKNEEL